MNGMLKAMILHHIALKNTEMNHNILGNHKKHVIFFNFEYLLVHLAHYFHSVGSLRLSLQTHQSLDSKW